MTLKEWEEGSGVVVREFGTGGDLFYVPYSPIPHEWYPKLWSLSDFRVTSVSGGTVWLRKRKERNEEHHS